MPKFLVTCERSFEFTVEADSEELLTEAVDDMSGSEMVELEGSDEWDIQIRGITEKIIPEFGIIPEGELNYDSPSLVEWDTWNEWNEARIEAKRQAFGGCGWDDDQTLPLFPEQTQHPQKGELEVTQEKEE